VNLITLLNLDRKEVESMFKQPEQAAGTARHTGLEPSEREARERAEPERKEPSAP
jgi:hypothetical protein